MSALPRIELDQDDPKNGDRVTFTVTRAKPESKYSIRLVLGPAQEVNHYPPGFPLQDEERMLADQPSFQLQVGDCTGVAWLLRDGVPQVGTLFWVQA